MRPGEIVAGRFEVERHAGAGGMSTVYLARDRTTGTKVAIKVMQGEAVGALAVRFTREIATLAELSHPGIVRYVAHGTTVDGADFLAMEWLEGEDLSDHLANAGLTLAESVSIVRQAASALSEAHRRGIVHRDLKPSNLFLVDRRADRVKLLDFGIARRTREARALTRTGVLLGTPEYMAPEQARGLRDVDARADVFSLGCVLFECATGQPAFMGDNLMAVLARILLDDAPRLASMRADVPRSLDELVARMLSRDPAQRPADADAVVRALDALDRLDDAARVGGARPSARPPALTSHEQRVVCVVLAGVAAAPDASGPTQVMVGEARGDPRAESLRDALRPWGATLEWLAGGAAVVMLTGAASATDLATRAARCALSMRAILTEAPMVLTTGRGVVASDGASPAGEVIDRAARLMALARDGGAVVVDQTTAGLLDAQFHIGGVSSAPVLLGERDARERIARTVLGQPTHCVGRERELALLDGVLDECASEPVARVVLLTGAAGAGKSRLVQEFLQRASRRDVPPTVLLGQADAVSAGSPFALIARALRRSAGMLDGEPIETRRAKLRARIARHVSQAANLARLGEFLGEVVGAPVDDALASIALRTARSDAMVMADATRTAWEDFIAAESDAAPVLIVLEDLHWGDGPSAQFVDATLRNLPERAVMVLATARPDVREVFPRLWEGREV